jgi:hypothetical protein
MPLVTLPFRAPTLAAIAGLALVMLTPVAVQAAPPPVRVGVLGPSDVPILPRLQRNVASLKYDAVHATVTVCTRDVVTRLLSELHVDSALCADGDSVSVWTREGDKVVLKEVVVAQGPDERAQELTAARAVMALAPPGAKEEKREDPSSFTIVANGAGATITPTPNNPLAPTTPSETTKDTAGPRPPRSTAPAERITPKLVLGAGPAMAASRHGNSFAISAEAQIGVSRYVALVPWLQFVPANRTAEAALGTATFRPTLFGLGFGIPLLKPSSVIVPRIGGGYAILWMHVSPETATGAAQMRKPEDLLAPVMYTTFAASVAVASGFRIVGEGMVGVSSHDMVVRIGNEKAAHWGVPLASLAVRGEWVLP